MAALPRLPALFNAAPRRSDRARRESVWGALGRVAETAGWRPWRLALDVAALAIGPGRISAADYERLKLYDLGVWGVADRREVVGAAEGARLARIANFRRDCTALAADRLAASAYLAAHGLPAVPVLAIFRADLATPGPSLLRTRGELRQFLQGHADAPLIAQLAEGGAPRTLFAAGGVHAAAEIDRMVDDAADTPGVSWLFLPRLAAHPAIARQTAGRTTHVRLLTLSGDQGVRVVRAYWRLGGRDDLHASLDLRSGAALAFVRAAEAHRSRSAPAGAVVPDWPAIKAVASEGARLFSQFGLLAWDIAPTAEGPMIVGVDPAPNFDLHQLIDQRGLLDADFRAFLAERRGLGAEWRALAP